MAEQTRSSVLVDASPSRAMGGIADFPRYPEWAQGVHACEVREIRPDGRAREVYFELEATPIRDSYTLVYDWQGDDAVTWALSAAGRMLRRLDGAYRLSAVGGGTEVTYDLAVELGIPMIGMLKRKAEKVIIDTALRGLKTRMEGSG